MKNRGRRQVRGDRNLRWIAIGALVVACHLPLATCHSQESSGAAFLKIDVGARAIGMGGAFTALANDASAAYWNPAGLAQLSRREALASHAEWIGGMSHEYGGLVQPGLFGGTLGLSLSVLRSGAIEGRDASRQAVGTFSSVDQVAALSFAKDLDGTRVGVSAKYIEQKLGSRSAAGLAADLGLQRALPVKGMSFGLAAQNIGPSMSYSGSQPYALPLRLKAGLGYQPTAMLGMDADLDYRPREHAARLAYGVEFKPASRVSMRAGYRFDRLSGFRSAADGGAAGLPGFQGGLGLALGSSYRLDYAFTPMGDAGAAQRLSFAAQF
jgi:hypothetical protein